MTGVSSTPGTFRCDRTLMHVHTIPTRIHSHTHMRTHTHKIKHRYTQEHTHTHNHTHNHTHTHTHTHTRRLGSLLNARNRPPLSLGTITNTTVTTLMAATTPLITFRAVRRDHVAMCGTIQSSPAAPAVTTLSRDVKVRKHTDQLCRHTRTLTQINTKTQSITLNDTHVSHTHTHTRVIES